MGDPNQRWRRVRGFGKHVDLRVIEFLEKLDYPNICNWCNMALLDTRALRCGHVICNRCYNAHLSGEWVNGIWISYLPCMFDQCRIANEGERFGPERNTLGDKQIRCLFAKRGCCFTGRLGALNEHLRWSCDFYFIPCSRCGTSVVYKDRRSHYITCQGNTSQVFLRAADVQSLLTGMGDACKKLEDALSAAPAGRRDALLKTVSVVNDEFAKIQSKLSAPSVPRT